MKTIKLLDYYKISQTYKNLQICNSIDLSLKTLLLKKHDIYVSCFLICKPFLSIYNSFLVFASIAHLKHQHYKCLKNDLLKYLLLKVDNQHIYFMRFLDKNVNSCYNSINLGIYCGKPFTGIVKNEHITSYFKNGKRHRTDGPAEVYPDGDKSYYLDGKYYTEDQFKQELKKSGIKPSPEYFKNLL